MIHCKLQHNYYIECTPPEIRGGAKLKKWLWGLLVWMSRGGLIPRGDLNFSEGIWGLITSISCSSHRIDFMSFRPQYRSLFSKIFACGGLSPKYIEDPQIFCLKLVLVWANLHLLIYLSVNDRSHCNRYAIDGLPENGGGGWCHQFLPGAKLRGG